ncbi:hypothetical protein [Methylobacterium iners]|uniref:hypothetical protein n=1 Tax=Methylobacterium iners TaxID=418707 RepID=UPI001EE19240|nr:hypothetical protein [Methylobacterium iners]
MTKQPSHPFNLDIRRCRFQADTFVWSISERGGEKRRSPQSYATFEDARLAMKEVLQGLIADRHAAVARASDHGHLDPPERMASGQ